MDMQSKISFLLRAALLGASLTIAGVAVSGAAGLVSTVDGTNLVIGLPDNVGPDTYRQVEWSANLSDWEPVARDYGFAWQNTFPSALPISGPVNNQQLSQPIESLIVFRLSEQAAPAYSNAELVVRFLQQATFGPTRELINTFPGIDEASGFNDYPYSWYSQWIDAQMALPISSHRAYFRERSNPAFVDNSANSPFEVGHNPAYGHQLTYWTYDDSNQTVWVGPDENDADQDGFRDDNGRRVNDVSFSRSETKNIIWYNIALEAPDALRQRAAWSLSQIFVLGEPGSVQADATERWVTYYDIFVRNAFGNFRDILGEVTFNPVMGDYLTYLDNRKANPDLGTFPDENYAREVMQLFTIGLWKLNQDGTRMVDGNGEEIPTYDNDDIFEFAKVFTGLRKQYSGRGGIGSLANVETKFNSNFIDPMRMQANRHDFTAKTLLDGSTLGPYPSNSQGGIDEINAFLDHLFNHPNTPPFISRLLIQRLTVSNPSPAYIHDVAQAFIDGTFNGVGSGQRGDLAAVFRAILLHPEAREPALAMDDAHGKLREPLIRILHYARAFEITSSQTFGFFPFWQLHQLIAQSPYEYPSVFNFYLPEYQPIGSIQNRGLFSPEFEIATDVTALGLINSIRTLIFFGIDSDGPNDGDNDGETDIGPRWYSQANLDLTHELGLAGITDDLIDHLDLILTAGRLTGENRARLQALLDPMPTSNRDQLEAKVKTALWLFSFFPEFNTLY
jgi:uncharacterized protein (DUF1800 family)